MFIFTAAASHLSSPIALNISLSLSLFPRSDLLSSDYVEIHYEGGKPVQSKVSWVLQP